MKTKLLRMIRKPRPKEVGLLKKAGNFAKKWVKKEYKTYKKKEKEYHAAAKKKSGSMLPDKTFGKPPKSGSAKLKP